MLRVPQSLPRLVDRTRECPNQSGRIHGPGAVRLVVVHTPEGSYASALATCLGRVRRVSYHLLLREDGQEATQLVAWDRKAWHAGAYNSASEGIAIAGWAATTRALSPAGRRAARIVAFRLRARRLPPRWARDGGGKGFCRHADVQADRRDPMSLGRWFTFVALVKYEYHRQGFRRKWGR